MNDTEAIRELEVLEEELADDGLEEYRQRLTNARATLARTIIKNEMGSE
jgi:hypothetical protein